MSDFGDISEHIAFLSLLIYARKNAVCHLLSIEQHYLVLRTI
jgi:hypothetical protein